MTRTRLPNRRPCESFSVVHDQQRFTVSIGWLDMAAKAASRPPLEVFVNAEKTSSSLEALARDGAILIALALQYGVPAEEMKGAITRGYRGEPATLVGRVLDALVGTP